VGCVPTKTLIAMMRRCGAQGFMNVLVNDESQLLVGAAILELNGNEVVHRLLDVMAARQPYTIIARSVPIHPTVSELLPTLLQQLKPLD
jgi:pyruvate/2-oxoglutarate dehydrogenase complex dihydrolipoamide dehydrogenase (E3) component